jgi:hypothetical protein
MSSPNRPKLPQNQDDGEMTKVGVSCQCHAGEKPLEGEMTKIAQGAYQCKACGKTWGGAPTANKGFWNS